MNRLAFWAVFFADLAALVGLVAFIGVRGFAWFFTGIMVGSIAGSVVAALVLRKNPRKEWESAFARTGVVWWKVAVLPAIIIGGGFVCAFGFPFLTGICVGGAVIAYYLVALRPLLFLIDEYRRLFDERLSRALERKGG